MTEYVCCFAYQKPQAVVQSFLLIEKQKPAWQKGKLNLPGGKIEEGETIEYAAVRELWEETGIRSGLLGDKIQILGRIEGDDWVVHVVECPYNDHFGGRRQTPMKLTDEMPFEAKLDWLETHQDKLIPNLRVIIPLCAVRAKGWVINDVNKSHEFSMSLATVGAA